MTLSFWKPEPKAKKARKGLKRTRLKRKSARRISRKSDAERYYTGWVHTRPCAGKCFTDHVCEGPMEQAHIRDMTGLGLKASEFLSIHLCQPLHRAYDQALPPFTVMGKTGRKSWFYGRIIEAHADFQLEHGCAPEAWEASNR